MALEVEPAALKLLGGETIKVQAGGQELEILPEEVEVRLIAREGYSVAAEGSRLAALVTELTPELVAEGLSREFVRRVQDLLKAANLEISDRIQLFYVASPVLAQAVELFKDYILAETLSISIEAGDAPDAAYHVEDSFDDEQVTIYLVKA